MENIFCSSEPPRLSEAPNASRSLSDQDWNGHRATFEWLYCSENKGLKEVMKIMEKDHGFLATSVPTCARKHSSSQIPLAPESILTLG
jgi:hypothetical protein